MYGSKFRNEEQMPSSHELGVAVRKQYLAPAEVLLAPTEPEKLPQHVYKRNLLRTHMAHSLLLKGLSWNTVVTIPAVGSLRFS